MDHGDGSNNDTELHGEVRPAAPENDEPNSMEMASNNDTELHGEVRPAAPEATENKHLINHRKQYIHSTSNIQNSLPRT